MSRTEWKARHGSDGSSVERDAGGFRLGITDQRDRNCGWCWHVSLTEPDRNGEIGEIAGGGGKETSVAAAEAAELYVREFCRRSLSALGDHSGLMPTMLKALMAASHALKSYQHGNSAPDLACVIVAAVDDAIAKATVKQPTPSREQS